MLALGKEILCQFSDAPGKALARLGHLGEVRGKLAVDLQCLTEMLLRRAAVAAASEEQAQVAMRPAEFLLIERLLGMPGGELRERLLTFPTPA